jgi:hypothetical protein
MSKVAGPESNVRFAEEAVNESETASKTNTMNLNLEKSAFILSPSFQLNRVTIN